MPAKGFESKVSANTHLDDIERQMEIVQQNSQSYLRVVKPHLIFKEAKNPEKHFPIAKQEIDKLIQSKAIVKDNNNSLYIYRQFNTLNGDDFVGIIALVSVDDYYNGKIKIHENTITEKEEQLIDHIDHSGVIGEPVLMTHSENSKIVDVLNHFEKPEHLLIDFEDEFGKKHTVYQISSQEDLNEINKVYDELECLYIADGHHRSAASAGFYKRNNIQNGCYLSYIVPPDYLKIDSFHRAYKSNTPFNSQDFLKEIEYDFFIDEVLMPYKPHKARDFGLFINSKWYKLTYKNEIAHLNVVQRLDVSILEYHIFNEILNVKDSKTDKQLTFLNGSYALEQIEKDVINGEYDFVFTVFPCNINQVFFVADDQLIMPPKSTFIEPKLRTGLIVQQVRD